MTGKRQCEIGPTKYDRAAVRKWERLQRCAGPATAPGSVSSSVPAPPPPGTAVAARCYGKWSLCWKEAQAIDALNVESGKLQTLLTGMRALKPSPTKEIASLSKMIVNKQSEVRKKMIALGYQQQAYLDCVKGARV